MTGIRELVRRVSEYFKNMPRERRARLILLLALAVALVVAASVLLSRKNYEVLYTNTTLSEAGEVKARLDELGVANRVDGSTIYVDSLRVDDMRVQLAMEGYPKSGQISYSSMWESMTGMMTTDADRKFIERVQLQVDIGNSLSRMDMIDSAVVNIAPGNEGSVVLQKDKVEPSVSVLLQVVNGRMLTDAEASTIANYVKASVTGLKLENISLTDTNANQYVVKEGEVGVQSYGTQLEMTLNAQERIRAAVLNLLQPVFLDKVRVAVYAELNFDDVTVQEVFYSTPNNPDDPTDRGIMVSMEAVMEGINGEGAGDVVGFDPNGAAPQYPEGGDSGGSGLDYYSYAANYEINEVQRYINQAHGKVTDLTVSVLLDANITNVEDWLDEVRQLVANTANVSVEHITVACLPFAGATGDDISAVIESWGMITDKMNSAELLRQIIWVGAALALAIILFAIIMTLRKKDQPVYVEDEGEYLTVGADYMADEDLLAQMNAEQAAEIKEKEDSLLTQVEDYIDKSPESVAQLLRNWLSSD